jgi:hypothetical protein
MLGDEPLKLGFGMDWNTLRILRPRQHGRIRAAFDIRYLRGGKANDAKARVVSIAAVEIVKVPTSRAED